MNKRIYETRDRIAEDARWSDVVAQIDNRRDELKAHESSMVELGFFDEYRQGLAKIRDRCRSHGLDFAFFGEDEVLLLEGSEVIARLRSEVDVLNYIRHLEELAG